MCLLSLLRLCWKDFFFKFCAVTDLSPALESTQPRVGGNDKSGRTSSILQGQVRMLGSQKQVWNSFISFNYEK